MELNLRLTKHFKIDNFCCPHCKVLHLTDRFYRHIRLLEGVRIDLGFPLLINSGERCIVHNINVGGEVKSQHLIFATDVTPEFIATDTDAVWEIKLHSLQEAFLKTFDGVGFYNTFCHGDLRGIKAFWDYRKKV